MSKKVKRDPVKVMLKWTILLAILAVIAFVGGNMLTGYRAQLLADKQAEVEEINAQRDEEYAVALAEFEQASTSGANLAWPAQKSEGWDVVDLTNYPLENAGRVTVSRQDLMYNGMLLVNQWHSRPDDFVDAEIVSVGNYTGWKLAVSDGNVKLFPKAIDSLQAAVAAAAEAGHKDYMVSEGYRSWEDQNALFQKRMESLQSRYSGDALIEQAKKHVNYPGTSEFNSGLSFTLRLYNRDDASVGRPAYETTAAGQWMSENCWKYGIVFRFPLADFPLKGTVDKAFKTGISSELYLYRYVGRGNAAVMHHLDLCLEEYVEYLQAHPHIAVFEDGTLRYEIFRQYVGDDVNSISLELAGKARSYEASLDNMGGVITVFEY